MISVRIVMTQARGKIPERQQVSTSFLFLGGVLSLDLTNTDILLRGKKHELLNTVEDARRWWREASIQHPDRHIVKGEVETTEWNDILLASLKRLRDALRHLFTAVIERRPVDEEDLEELNRVLAIGYQSLEMGAGGKPTTIYRTTEPPYGAVLLPIALSALNIITQGEPERLHKCANERCVGLFYDTTRSATRHWCSSACMNRARSLHHYREAKARKALPTAFPARNF
jgi:predicted RNA-binding Zn ribbon-like protein